LPGGTSGVRRAIAFSIAATAALICTVVVANQPDLYISTIFAGAGDAYLFWLSARPSLSRTSGRGLPPLLFVAIGPAICASVMGVFGELGSPEEAALRGILMTGFSVAFLVSTFPLPISIRAKVLEGKTHSPAEPPVISVIVPAFNEQSVISRTLQSLDATDYEPKEVIVVDDGSTDLTYCVANSYRRNGVRVLRQPNGGKASALNHALIYAQGDIVVTIDSDSMVTREALGEAAAILSGEGDVAAVAGNVKVLNGSSLLARVQSLEYAMALNTIRRAYGALGTVMVIPGAFGAFRRRDLKDVMGYDNDTLTEDFDLTLRLLEAKRSIVATQSGVIYTEVPSTTKALFKQRLRWATGTFQTVYKHKSVLTDRKYGRLQSVGFPMILLSLVNPFTSFLALGAGVALALTGNALVFAEMVGFFFLAQCFVALVALSLDSLDLRLVRYSPLFVFGYRQFNDFATVVSAFRAMRGSKLRWSKSPRLGGTDSISI
jgi:poly-beta-1,6-N-acetyl-D-glucosamine synthase